MRVCLQEQKDQAMTKTQIVPIEPTEAMVDAALAVKVDGIAGEGSRSRLRRCLEAEYKASVSAAPDPTENTELVERVARWMCCRETCDNEAYGIRCHADRNGSTTEAKDLLKVIQGKE